MSESHVEHPGRIFVLALATVALISVMNTLAKLASDQATIAQIVFFRNFFAFIPIILLIKQKGDWPLMKTENPVGHFLRGLTGMIAMGCFFSSFVLLPMANATVIHFTSPLLLTILSIPLLGEKVGKHRWMAVLVGLFGVYFMVRPDTASSDSLGTIVAFAAAFFAAFAMVFVRKLGQKEHALTIVFYFTIYGTVLSGIAMCFFWNDLSLYSVFLLVCIGVIGGIGQVLLTYVYSQAPAAYVAPFNYTAIIFAVLADIIIWNVWPQWEVYVGSLIIMASGLYIVFREAQKKKRLALRTNLYGLQPARPTQTDLEEK